MTPDTLDDGWSFDYLNDTANWVKTYPVGRICDHEGCATILSRYNATMYCGAHPPDTGLRFHGMTFQQCACGAVTGRESKSGACRKCADAKRRAAGSKSEQQRLKRGRDRSRARYWADPEGERERQRKYRQGLVPAALLEEVT